MDWWLLERSLRRSGAGGPSVRTAVTQRLPVRPEAPTTATGPDGAAARAGSPDPNSHGRSVPPERAATVVRVVDSRTSRRLLHDDDDEDDRLGSSSSSPSASGSGTRWASLADRGRERIDGSGAKAETTTADVGAVVVRWCNGDDNGGGTRENGPASQKATTTNRESRRVRDVIAAEEEVLFWMLCELKRIGKFPMCFFRSAFEVTGSDEN